jgi:O-antigen/teichoic acid export membrane protein
LAESSSLSLLILLDTRPDTWNKKLTTNTLWVFLGDGVRLPVQAGYFILIARTLQVEQYGAFIGVTALVAIVTPFASLGTGSLLVKNVSRDRPLFQECWGNALGVTLCFGSALVALLLSTSQLLLPRSIPFKMVLLVSVADLVFTPMLGLAAQAFQAFEMLNKTTHLNVLLSVSRLGGAAMLAVAVPQPTGDNWSLLYLLSSATASVIGITWVLLTLGTPKVALTRVRSELVEGLYFSSGLAAQTIYNDVDKIMLVRMATLNAAGIYAAAYRIVEVAFAPIRSVLSATYPQFFQRGSAGLQTSFAFARFLLRRTTLYAVFACLALEISAPILPRVLGPDYGATVEALRWLALLLVLKNLHYFVADSLTGAGHQGVRTLVQTAVACCNVLLNLWLIPNYSWRGAAWASLASDSLLVAGLGVGILLISRQHRRAVAMAGLA